LSGALAVGEECGGSTVSSAFGGGTGGDRDVISVGPSSSVAVPTSGVSGYASLVVPSDNVGDRPTTLPATLISLGAGGVGSPTPHTSTVVHPLDAFPGSRRGVNEEATGRRDAEAFRRRVATAQRRQDYISLHAYPHGVLGLDGPDNLESPVYGEVAHLRLLEANRRAERNAAREAALLRQSNSVARRGYDLIADPSLSAGLAVSARLSGGPQSMATLADGKLAALDGVKFLERKGEAVPLYGQGVDTRRSVGVHVGEGAKIPAQAPTRPARVEAVNWARTQGRATNPITHQPLPAPISPPKHRNY